MWFDFLNIFKKKDLSINIPKEVITAIQADVAVFVEYESTLYTANPDNQLENFVIFNLANFDLSSLSTQNGIDQIKNLLSDHYSQLLGRRLKQLMLDLYIKYGSTTIEDIIIKTYVSMIKVYHLNPDTVNDIDTEYNTFWLQPFIRYSYHMLNLLKEKE